MADADVSTEPPGEPSDEVEFTVDELAARANMTVRNVRAYAARGLIDPPRLEGRTGYYHRGHLQRLQLVRDLLDRGYTLAAVEKAVLSSPASATAPALDLLHLLDEPWSDVEPELMSRDALAALAQVDRDDGLIDALVEFGLAAWVEDDHESVLLVQPAIVRNGAAAVALGLPANDIIALFPLMRRNLREIADAFVSNAVEAVAQPFIDRGLPPEEAPQVLGAIEKLLPVASQVTYAMFRQELAAAIDAEIGSQLDEVGLRASRRGTDD
jgi:DNA-binding transcriptional MerR regulator